MSKDPENVTETAPSVGPPRLRHTAVLTAINGCVSETVTINDDVTWIGSDDSLDAVMQGPDISPRHASITRMDNEYILKDNGSESGTFVDGVPVVSCVLRNGDCVQIGNHLFYFDRILFPEMDARADGRAGAAS